MRASFIARERCRAGTVAKCAVAAMLALLPLSESYPKAPKPAAIKTSRLMDANAPEFSALPGVSAADTIVEKTFEAARKRLSNVLAGPNGVITGFSGVSTVPSFSSETAVKVLYHSLPGRKNSNKNFFQSLLSNSYNASLEETNGLWGFSFSQNGVKLNYSGKDSVELVLGQNTSASIIEAMGNGWVGVMHSTLSSGYSWMSASFRIRDGTIDPPRSYIAFGFTNLGKGVDPVLASGTMVRLPAGWVVVNRKHLLSSNCCEGYTPCVYAEIQNEVSGAKDEVLIMGSSLFSRSESAKVRIFMAHGGVVSEHK
jgi:hypothetical protein